jgi:Zn-dependent protease
LASRTAKPPSGHGSAAIAQTPLIDASAGGFAGRSGSKRPAGKWRFVTAGMRGFAASIPTVREIATHSGANRRLAQRAKRSPIHDPARRGLAITTRGATVRSMSRRDPYWDSLFGREAGTEVVEAEHEAPAPEPVVERDYQPVHPQSGAKSLARKLAAPFVAVGLLIWKAAPFFAALFKLKLFATAGTMAVSIAAYALLWGWKFGVALVLLIFVHELGHVIELRRQGVPASAPLFIPFLGAMVGMKQLPADVWREARVALAGPIVGSVGAAACWGLGEALDSEFLVAMAFVGFFLNLFNLLPVVPLDGGRAIAALHPAFWLVGLVGLTALMVYRPSPILLIIVVLGAFELWNRWKSRHEFAQAGYYRIKPWQRAAVGVTYLGLAALLAVGMLETHIEKTF